MTIQTTHPVEARLPIQSQILSYVRQRIVTGELGPGSRVPTQQQLRDRFNASPMTVQRAMSRLLEEGFVVPQGARGTFVSEHPPHLFRYGMVFPFRPGSDGRWPLFWSRLQQVARSMQAGASLELAQFYDTPRRWQSRSDDYSQLESAVLGHGVAGLIFASNPHPLIGTPVLTETDIPRVAVMEGVNEQMPNVAPVRLDRADFLAKALDALKERGRRRVAMLGVTLSPEQTDPFVQGVRERGMQTETFWLHAASTSMGEPTRNWAQLLMNIHQTHRPDALIVSDDNLVPHTVAGLGDAGVRIGEDIDVIAHCNFPDPTPTHPRVMRLGFDARTVLQRCLSLVDEIRATGVIPANTIVPARFETPDE